MQGTMSYRLQSLIFQDHGLGVTQMISLVDACLAHPFVDELGVLGNTVIEQ